MNFPFDKLKEDFANETIYEIIRDLAPYMIYLKSNCSWMNDEKPCSQYLRMTLTAEGLCYSFNMLNSDEIYTKQYVRCA